MRVTCLERVYSPSLRRSLPSFPLPSLRQRGPGRARASGGAPGCVRGGARSSAMYKGTNGKNTLAHERLMCGETAPPLRSLLKAPPRLRSAAGAHPGAPPGSGAGSGCPRAPPAAGPTGDTGERHPWDALLRGGQAEPRSCTLGRGAGWAAAAVALCGQQHRCSKGRSGENEHKRGWKSHQQSPGSCT